MNAYFNAVSLLLGIRVRPSLFSLLSVVAGLGLFNPGDFTRADAAEVPGALKDVGITEKLGEQVAIADLEFQDESGANVKLAKYFESGRPVLLTLLYYECPNLCNFALNGLVDGMKEFEWTPGQKFEVVTVSIDPREGPALAAAKKAAYLKSYGRPEAAAGWHFLTAKGDSAKRLADQVGFGYKWDETEKQFAHGAGLFVLTPTGKLSRILYGIQYKPKELRLSLLEASDGKIGTIIDRIVLFCYSYNPSTRKYSVTLTRLMQTSSVGMVFLFGGYLGLLWRRERRQNQKQKREKEERVTPT